MASYLEKKDAVLELWATKRYDTHNIAWLLEMHEADVERLIRNELEAARQNRDRFFEINEQFHRRLLELADNRWRDQMVADLRKVMKLNRHNSLLKSGRIEESMNEHRGIVQALLARDPHASAQRMQAHFQNGLQAAA